MSTAGNSSGVVGTTPNGTGNVSVEGGNPIEALVGEGKKFKTIEDMARGKLAADAHIATLEAENRALKESQGGSGNAVLARIDELLAKVNGQGTTTQVGNQSTTESLTEDKVRAILHQERQAAIIDGNVAKFNEVVTKTFGDKAGETMKSKIASLGFSDETFSRLVAENPESALKLVGILPANSGASGQKESTVNTAALFNGQDNSRKNHAYYEKLRRDLKMDFFKPEIQQEMIAERKRQGSDFWK